MWYLTPVNLYDMASMEFWLERMAGRGRFLVSAGPLFSVFSREAPKASRYRAEPLDVRSPIPTQDRLDYYESCGWSYQGTVKNFYRIFRADDPAAVELHTDPAVLASAMGDLVRRTRRSLRLLIICLLLFLLCLAFPPLVGPGGAAPLRDRLLLLCNILLCGWNVTQLLGLRSLRRQLKAGSLRSYGPTHYRRAAALRLAVLFFVTALWLSVILLPCFLPPPVG